MIDEIPALPAASVLILDDQPDLHVLIGQRRLSSIFVGGMIVFPGGGVEPEDRNAAARQKVPEGHVPDLDISAGASLLHAAIRETEEEVGLDIAGPGPVDPINFPHVGHWITPCGAPRRYDTHFFLARSRGGEVMPDGIELTEAWWERPDNALRRITTGDLNAILPTIEFLRSLAMYSNVSEAFEGIFTRERRVETNGWTAL